MTNNWIDENTSPEELIKGFADAVQQSKKTALENAEKERLDILNDIQNQEENLKPYLQQDSWLLVSEAIPLNLGYGRKSLGIASRAPEFSDIYRLSKADAGQSLKILNLDQKEQLWRVKPKDFVSWLNLKGFDVLPALEDAFLVKRKASNTSEPHPNAERHAVKREQILQAALAVLAAYPDQCLNDKKEISATRITNIIEEKSPVWFGEDDIPLSRSNMEKLIRKAINTLKK